MDFERVYALFQAARVLETPAARTAYLDAHADDTATRHRVEDLLDHHEAADTATTDARHSPLRAALEDTWSHASGVPERIGPYRILGVLGRGGMATVYRAAQEDPKRVVALKVLHPTAADTAALSRFRQEAEVLARLAHEGIAPIFDLGEAEAPDGRHAWLAMQLVEGRHLNDVEGPRGVEEAVDLLLQVLDATAHAHQHGIVHRDLKPSNVIVDARGRCKLLDFGIARILDEDSRHTATGDVLGTLRYMSPEQAVGDGRLVDTRTDVRAVGVMAYELLAGRHPLADVEGGPAAILQAVLRREPAPLRRVAPHVPADLATIVHKALAHDPDRRYDGAAAFAADLRRFVRGLPVEARDPTLGYQVRKFVGRHRTFVLALSIALVALVSALVLSLTSLKTANEQRALAAARTEAMEAGAARLRWQAADVALREDRVASALEHLEAVPVAHRGWVWRYLHARCDTTLASIPRPGDPAAVRVTRDGRLLPVAVAAGERDHENAGFRVHHGEDGGEPAVLRAPPAWQPVPWIPGAAARLEHERVHVRLAEDVPLVTLASLRAAALVVDPEGRRLLVGTHDRRVVAWDPLERDSTDLGIQPAAAVTALAWDGAKARLAVASARGVVQVFRLPDATRIETLRAGARDARQLLFLDGGRTLVGLSRSEVFLWELGAARAMARLPLATQGRRAFIYGVAVAPDGRRAAVASWGGDVELFDLVRMRSLGRRELPGRKFHALRFLTGGRELVVQGAGRLHRLDAQSGEVLASRGRTGSGEDLAVSPAAGVAAVLRLGPQRCEVHALSLGDAPSSVVALPPAPVESGHDPRALRGSALAFDAAGQRLLRSASGGWALHRWPDGQLLASGPVDGQEGGAVLRLRFLPDGGFVAGTSRGDVIVYDLPSGVHRRRLVGHEDAVHALALHPSEAVLASGGADGTVRLWSLETGAPLLVLTGHEEYVKDLAFTPDGESLVSGSGDGTLGVWSTRSLAARRAAARRAETEAGR